MKFRQELINSNTKILIYLVCISLCLITKGYAQQESPVYFTYKYLNNDNFRIEARNIQSIYLNNELYEERVEIRNNILVKILARNSDDFEIYNEVETIEDEQLLSTQNSTFTQYRHGLMIVPSSSEVPFVRSIPKFPLQAVSVGDEWEELGQENILLPEANEYILINVKVNYRYLGLQDLPRNVLLEAREKNIDLLENAHIINAKYTISNRTFFNPNINKYQTINSSYDVKMWWNLEESRMEYYEEEYTIEVSYQEADVVRFSGKASAIMIKVPTLDKSIEILQDEIKKHLENVEVSNNEKGITLSLQNINFNANSVELEASELEKLAVIAKILLRYNDRRFLIEGHTALAGTQKDRDSLSNLRAKAVVNILREYTAFREDQFIYRGWGAERPVASNYTEEGKAKNRRVEITILEN